MTCFVRIDLEGCQTEAALIGWINGALDFVTTLPVERSPKASCQREEGRHRPWSTRRDAEVPAYVIMKRPQLGARQRGSRGHQRLVTWAAPMQYRPIARTGQTWPRVHMVLEIPVTSDFVVADSIRLEQVALDGRLLLERDSTPQEGTKLRLSHGGKRGTRTRHAR
jgi:hypothetical protein